MVIEEPRPKKRPTIVTWVIIILCVIFFIATLDSSGMTIREVPGWWFVPDEMFKGQNLHTLITAAFLHGNWIHIISNMYILWVFGDDAEDTFGYVNFIVFYLFCAVFASFFFAVVLAVTESISGLYLMGNACVGASGAIFGVMAAYALFFPNRTLLIPGWGRVRAKYYIAIYAIFEIIYTVLDPTGLTAHSAHVGGFVAGILFAFVFKKLMPEKFEYTKTHYLPAGRTKKKESTS